MQVLTTTLTWSSKSSRLPMVTLNIFCRSDTATLQPDTVMDVGRFDFFSFWLVLKKAASDLSLLSFDCQIKFFDSVIWCQIQKFWSCYLVPAKIFGFSLLVPAKIWPSTFPPTTIRIFLFSEKSIGPMQKCCISFL